MQIHHIDYPAMAAFAKIAAGVGDHEEPGLSITRKIGVQEMSVKGHFETNLGPVSYFICIETYDIPQFSFKVTDGKDEIKSEILLHGTEENAEKVFVNNARNIGHYLFQIVCLLNAREANREADRMIANNNSWDALRLTKIASDMKSGQIVEWTPENALEMTM